VSAAWWFWGSGIVLPLLVVIGAMAWEAYQRR
jgi:hypothetical protein